ncbi:hypothetical protein [Actinomadura sp. SCN-SB]|uniref:hypothetical protein n=1 Tax=Actinomadura sp. SCN-SB TaxID=3373092 RepID=UPI0037506010
MTVTEAHTPLIPLGTASPAVRLTIEYWTVTMDEQDSCGSCDATLTLLNDAVTTIGPVAARLGFTLGVVPRTITTWSEALEHGIVASPTIRAQGREMLPSHPDGSESRAWDWRGTITPSPRPEALLDFLVQVIAKRSRQLGAYLAEGGPAPYVRQFLHTPAASPAANQASATTSCGPDACG